MGFRFRKTIRLGSLLRLNVSKSGLSTSVGKPGASINVGPRGVSTNVGLPGTGLSYRSTRRMVPTEHVPGGGWMLVLLLIILLALLAGCAGNPTFTDAPAVGKPQASVIVESRIADLATVSATCSWKAREGGTRFLPGTSIKGCTFEEHGRYVILWTDPKSFTNVEAFEVAGHELYHRHNFIDHK